MSQGGSRSANHERSARRRDRLDATAGAVARATLAFRIRSSFVTLMIARARSIGGRAKGDHHARWRSP